MVAQAYNPSSRKMWQKDFEFKDSLGRQNAEKKDYTQRKAVSEKPGSCSLGTLNFTR